MKSYFLGANSRAGFFSLYDEFPPDGAYLHIIKGGPGTGKSTLLKTIAAAAEARGLEVQRVLCSGDPDSLDGVYVPALGSAWADGTAPHVLEPRLFGVTGDYLNMSDYLLRPFSEEERARLFSLQEEYRALYGRVYALLSACAELGGARCAEQSRGAWREHLGQVQGKSGKGTLERRFRSAITCKGLLRLKSEEPGYAVLTVSRDDLTGIQRDALGLGCRTIECLSPLDPAEPEAILLPEERLCFQTQPQPAEASREALEQAIRLLGEAKSLHDRIEQVYRPHMDFRRLSEDNQRMLEKLFPQ